MIERFRRASARTAAAALILVAGLSSGMAEGPDRHGGFRPREIPRQDAMEKVLLAVPDAKSLRRFHRRFCQEPHIAGTAADGRMIETLVAVFEEIGLEAERQELEVYLSHPESARLEIVSWAGSSAQSEPRSLSLQERALSEDTQSGHADLGIGFNAYSASGDVTAEVVYANYGTKADFARLKTLGVDVRGKIVIARYGGNYRGYKVKFAEEAGAVGTILYTDPEDSGYRVGVPYPEGGFANDSYIQRGSIKTLPYQGDPLTPFVAAVPGAKRLDPESLALPKIPSQPIGYGAAREILAEMKGRAAPRNWHGSLPLTYRLEGGPELRVRLQVKQKRSLCPTANVLATIRGAVEPERIVVLGCHFDAWSFGAGDPNAGTIVLYEVARAFAEAVKQGYRPARTLVFANWAAEEHGIIGSTEYCEANAARLREHGVAYINLDMAAMGSRVRSASAPPLKALLAEAARAVPQWNADPPSSIFDTWSGGRAEGPRFGSLGGGSDHVGFYCHLGIPSASLGAGGSPGVSYHSNYETLDWYWKVVGDDYRSAVMVSQLVGIVASRLANATIVPLDPVRVVEDTRTHLLHLKRLASKSSSPWPEKLEASLEEGLSGLEQRARSFVHRLSLALAEDRLSGDEVQRINRGLLQLERNWISEAGLPGRPWYRNLFASTDPNSGYAAWMLPGVRHAVETGDTGLLQGALAQVSQVLSRLESGLEKLETELLEKTKGG